jgi:dihydroorotase
VLDPSQNLRGRRDVAFAWGRVAAVAPPGGIDPGAARIVIEAAGKLVVPGLVDLHAHVYVGGSELVVPADEVCPPSGCTTVVDAGTAGGNTMLGLRLLAQRHVRTRVFAFVHISGIGLAGHPHGESRDLVYLDPELAARTVLAHRDFVLGVKVRQTDRLVGSNGLEPLRRAIAAAEMAEQAMQLEPGGAGRRVPVMVHVGGTPAPLAEVLELLRPGDVVTHCFTGNRPCVVDAAGRPDPACVSAQERGVHFDVGHGAGSFSLAVAQAAAEAGFWPNTISTDLHSMSIGSKAVDMPTTMSKFLGFGLPLEAVVARSTWAPAQFIANVFGPHFREPLLGSLQVGAPGDAAILEPQTGEFSFQDSLGTTWTGRERLAPVHCILGGRPWGRPFANVYLIP